MRAKDFTEISAEIARRVIDALTADGIEARFGASNVSCSTYVELASGPKIRFSNHDDYVSGADLTLRLDPYMKTIYAGYDMDGETVFLTQEDLDEAEDYLRESAGYYATDIDDADTDALVAEALGFAKTQIAE